MVVAGLVLYAEPPANPGDDPPVLKKKGAPDVDDSGLKAPADDKDKDKEKKPDAPKPDGDKPADQAKPRLDADEVLKGVAKSMRSAEEHLAKKELGDPTRQAQDDALKGLDSLIDLAENPPDDPQSKDNQSDKDNKDNKDNKDGKSSSQGGKNNKDNSSAGKPDPSRMPGDKSGSSSSSRSGQRRRGSKRSQGKSGTQPDSGNHASGDQQPGGQGDQKSQDPSNGKSNNGGNGQGSNNPQMAKDPNADLYKDVWGHLPETLRAEMNAYSEHQGLHAGVRGAHQPVLQQHRRAGPAQGGLSHVDAPSIRVARRAGDARPRRRLPGHAGRRARHDDGRRPGGAAGRLRLPGHDHAADRPGDSPRPGLPRLASQPQRLVRHQRLHRQRGRHQPGRPGLHGRRQPAQPRAVTAASSPTPCASS